MKEYLESFLDCYLKERDLGGTLSYMDENVISIGTGEHETARNKMEVKKLLEDEFASLPRSFEYEISGYTETKAAENIRNFFVNVYVWLSMEDEQFEMKSRLTGTFVKCGELWKISSIHMSIPSLAQEINTFFPLCFGSKTNGSLSESSETKLMELIAETVPGGIMGCFWEEGFPLYTINEKMLQILGYTYEEMVAATDEKMINTIHPDDRKRVEREIKEQFRAGDEYEIQCRVIGKKGRVVLVNSIGKKIITKSEQEAFISIATDITERAAKEQQLFEEATHDSLTQLYNRKQVRKLIEESFKLGIGGVLYICDVDHFKYVNDTRGHVFGDNVLRQISAIMRNRAAKSAIIGRLGGDEFIIYFPKNIDVEESKTIMKMIQIEFRVGMDALMPDLKISLSVGGAVREDEDLDTLYSYADQVLYQAKQKRGDFRMR